MFWYPWSSIGRVRFKKRSVHEIQFRIFEDHSPATQFQKLPRCSSHSYVTILVVYGPSYVRDIGSHACCSGASPWRPRGCCVWVAGWECASGEAGCQCPLGPCGSSYPCSSEQSALGCVTPNTRTQLTHPIWISFKTNLRRYCELGKLSSNFSATVVENVYLGNTGGNIYMYFAAVAYRLSVFDIAAKCNHIIMHNSSLSQSEGFWELQKE